MYAWRSRSAPATHVSGGPTIFALICVPKCEVCALVLHNRWIAVTRDANLDLRSSQVPLLAALVFFFGSELFPSSDINTRTVKSN